MNISIPQDVICGIPWLLGLGARMWDSYKCGFLGSYLSQEPET